MWCFTTHTQDQISGLGYFTAEQAVAEPLFPPEQTETGSPPR